MPYENNLRPRRGQVIIEPLHEKISAILHDPTIGRVKNTMRGRLISVAEGCDAELKAGLEVMFVPHGGTLLVVGDGVPERLVLPSDQIIGIVEP